MPESEATYRDDMTENAAAFDPKGDDVFARIAGRYDRLCDVFSLCIHRRWKSRMAHAIAAQPGDRFLIYTDGLTERFDPAGKTYGEERLLQSLATDSAQDPQGVIAAIMANVEQFASGLPADDDQALLLGIVQA